MASYRIHQSLVGKGALKINEFWPMESDKKEQKKFVMTAEERDRILKLHSGT